MSLLITLFYADNMPFALSQFPPLATISSQWYHSYVTLPPQNLQKCVSKIKE